MRVILISLIGLSLQFGGKAFAQSTDSVDVKPVPENWFNLDPEQDSVLGVSTEKAYTLLEGKTSKKVVVAVIDSGIDIEHEDLQGSIWTNEDEIAGNGIDDDNNGYVDDMHGWNFIGNASGENIDSDSYELTREYTRLSEKFDGEDSVKMRRKNKDQYKYYESLKKEFNKQKQKAEEEYQQFATFYRNYKFAKDILMSATKADTLTRELLDEIDSTSNEQLLQLRDFYANLLDHGISDDQVTEWQKHLEKQLNYAFNPEFDPRGLVGDDYTNFEERHYGNNDVEGPDASHGTHVAGIIGANRSNELGIKGIADNVSIMPIRAVPDGDERDKDIANAIYYAVDNGAQIINMSFGKSYSPQKEVVDKAVKYATEKGVLLIHAAGNSSKNIDEKDNFPTQKYANLKEGSAPLWIEVGASNTGLNNEFVGSFSNYGRTSVTLFAPGCEITSTTPDNNYDAFDGTSMASPVIAGVAALIMSYYPQLNAQQIKTILLTSARKYDNLEVTKPTTNPEKEERVQFSTLSMTGAIVNAYEAVKMADSMVIEKSN